MPQKLEITPRIADLLATASDGGIDPSKVSVFETISINTLPVSKNNIFSGAVHTSATLKEMASAVSSRPMKMNVPMHTNHDQGYGLPIGKVFHADVITNNSGLEELRSLFYLDNSEADLISKVETDTINEVSIGARYRSMNCSACGFDFMSDAATDDHIYDQTCANDHVIGQDGVHLMLNGLGRWMEQSLVSLGAANGAKIQARTRALLGADAYKQLRATGIDPVRTTLYASATLPLLKPKDNAMDLAALVARVEELVLAKAALTATVAERDAEIVRLKVSDSELLTVKPKLAAAEAEVATLKATDAVKTAAELKLAGDHIREEANRLAIAAGGTALDATLTLTDLTASIKSNRTKLADTFPTGGRSLQAGHQGEQKTVRPNSFKTNR